MKMAYNVTGEKRKDLVTAVSEIVGWSPVYKKAPTFAYVVSNYIIDKEGNLTGHGSVSDDENAKLLRTLEERGFSGDVVEFGETVSEPHDAERGASNAKPAEGNALIIDMPRADFSEAAIENLEKLIASKATLIKKALGVENLTVEKTGDKLRFPWFTTGGYSDEVTAYLQLISALCMAAKSQKRVTGRDKPTNNERYAFRCFLLKLGFIGNDYKDSRKVLLRNLEGSSAFRNGSKKNDGEDD